LVIYSHSSTNPKNLAKFGKVDFEIIDVTEIVKMTVKQETAGEHIARRALFNFYVYASVSEGEWACDRTCGTSRDSCHAHLSINHRPLDPLEYKTFWISVNDSLLSVGILPGRQAPRRSIVFARWSPTSPPLPQIRYIAVSNELSALNFALYRDIDVNECYVNETVTRVRSQHMNSTELSSELPDRGAEYCVDGVCLSLYVSVCYLSVCPRSYLRNKTSDLYQCFFHDTYVRGSVLLWRRCDTLCTSGFMDDITFLTQWPGIDDAILTH